VDIVVGNCLEEARSSTVISKPKQAWRQSTCNRRHFGKKSKPETRRCGRDQDGGDWQRSKYLPLCTALLAKGIFATAFWVGSVEHIHVNFCSIQRLALKSLCHDSAQSDARLHSSVYRALERAPK
jgi:hypothetical protein